MDDLEITAKFGEFNQGDIEVSVIVNGQEFKEIVTDPAVHMIADLGSLADDATNKNNYWKNRAFAFGAALELIGGAIQKQASEGKTCTITTNNTTEIYF